MKAEHNFPKELLPVLEYFDNSVVLLAASIQRSPQAIYAWGKEIPRLAAYDIEFATRHRFRAHDLNRECLK